MSAVFNEGLIERSYHTLWETRFTTRYGSRYLVYVPGKDEVHVGFDLGFAQPLPKFKFTSDDFFDWMKSRIRNTSRRGNAFLFGYFYQYKVIQNVPCLYRIRDKVTLEGLTNNFGYQPNGSPYRAKLNTKRNTYAKGAKLRPFSQHEALCRLSKIKEVKVAYCTPKFLKIKSQSKRSLSDLKLTAVDCKTPVYKDSDTHYLYFEDINGNNFAWCSDPIAGTSIDEPPNVRLLTPTQLFKLIKTNYLLEDDSESVDFEQQNVTEADLVRERFLEYMTALPSCTRIMAILK